MKTNRLWQGVRMRQQNAGADPDSPSRLVTLPVDWDENAANALATLAPGQGPISLAQAAEAWIRPVAESAQRAGLDLALADRLHRMLLQRQGAPGASLWALQAQTDSSPSFVLNLPAFYDSAHGFDLDAFAQAIETAVITLALAAPSAREIRVGMSDLAGLLAMLGIAYASPQAREVASCLAAVLRGRADLASSTLPRLSHTYPQDWPQPLAHCPIPGLAQAARQIHALAPEPRHRATTAILAPDATDALLGVETAGIAPAFSPLATQGGLTRTALHWLAATGTSPERALVAALSGHSPFPEAGTTARTAMHETVAPFLHSVPAPVLLTTLATEMPARRALPARCGGYTQKAAIGGHKVTLRTGEYEDGQLGEISLVSHKDGSTTRGLLDAVGAAVSLGLQHGVPLADFVELFVDTRFGHAGTVEGDPAVQQATSMLDYAFRHLAVHYLGRTDLPEIHNPEPELSITPLLPLDLPREKSQRRLRLVGE